MTLVSRLEGLLERVPVEMSDPGPSSRRSRVMLPLPEEHFTGRDEYLETVEAHFMLPQSSVELRRQRVFVFHGISGMGKTQLALTFLDKNRHRYTNS